MNFALQAQLDFDERSRWQNLGVQFCQSLHEALIQHPNGAKELSWNHGVDPGLISRAFGSGKHQPQARWAPLLVSLHPQHGPLRLLAEWNGFALVRKKKLSSDEKLAIALQKLRAFSPVLAADIEKEIGE